ncbi:MAG: alpha/beta fold hydrolase, partial [Streptosporangiaceae bacterium]
MRRTAGKTIPAKDRDVYVAESGTGQDWVVFEAGSGCGRTCWDPVLPLLADCARLVAYDRAGFGRSGRTDKQPGIDGMAADLAAMARAVVQG